MQISLDQIAADFAAGRYGPVTVRQLLTYARWQQEEIRRLETPGSPACEICFTDSWQPVAEDCPGAVPDPATGGFMTCGYCRLAELAQELEADIQRLTVERDNLQEAADMLVGRGFRLEARLAVVRRELGAME